MPFTPLPKCGGTINFAAPPPKNEGAEAASNWRPHEWNRIFHAVFRLELCVRSNWVHWNLRISSRPLREWVACVTRLMQIFRITFTLKSVYRAHRQLLANMLCIHHHSSSMWMENPFASSWSYYIRSLGRLHKVFDRHLHQSGRGASTKCLLSSNEVFHLFHFNLYYICRNIHAPCDAFHFAAFTVI